MLDYHWQFTSQTMNSSLIDFIWKGGVQLSSPLTGIIELKDEPSHVKFSAPQSNLFHMTASLLFVSFSCSFLFSQHDPVFSISYSHSRGIFLSFLSADRHHTHVQSYSICSSFIRWHMRWFVPCHALGSMNNHNAYLYEWSTSSMHQIFWSFINAPNFLIHINTHP